MANTINITVENLQTVLLSFDQIQVHRSATVAGTFVEITTALTRIDMNNQDNLYEFVDAAGTSTDWYKTRFFNSTTSAVSTLSEAFPVAALQQLLENMEIQIFVSDDVKNTSGINLTEDLDLYFTTTFNPLHCGVDKVLLSAGTFLRGVEADTINRAIWEASREADVLTYNTDAAALASPLYLHARRQWTCCMAASMLISNIINTAGGGVKAKRLGDFSVEYNSMGVKNMMDRLAGCIMAWEPQLNSGGAATQKATHVVKGDLNIDKTFVGRDYEPWAVNGLPMANAKIRRRGSRRLKKASLPAKLRSGHLPVIGTVKKPGS